LETADHPRATLRDDGHRRSPPQPGRLLVLKPGKLATKTQKRERKPD
jgi:hypothetical protein